MKKFQKFICMILSLALLCGNMSINIFAEIDGMQKYLKNSKELTDDNLINLQDKDNKIALDIANRKSTSSSSGSRSIDFNFGWKFYRNPSASSLSGVEGNDFDDSSWRKVDLPHDWSIELDFNKDSSGLGEAGFLDGGTAWYRKSFTLPQSMDGKRININFDGVYMNSTVYINGTLLGTYPNGYLPFQYDITDYVKANGSSINTIAVKVENKQPTSRWYSGSGIYRDVNLIVTDNIHVKNYGTHIITPNIKSEISSGKVTVNIKTKVQNDNKSETKVKVKQTIYDNSGKNIGESFMDEEKSISPNEVIEIQQNVIANNPKLWDTDNPNMYKLITEIIVDEKCTDIYETRFGFRWFEATPNDGFSLNGKYIKLNGVCMHHDQGALGSVQNYVAMERQMKIMKDMGVNAIRVTHCPSSTKFLEVCENLGLLVIDEAFDTWYGTKKDNDYGLYFAKPAIAKDTEIGMTWAEYDVKRMVEKGKNSPAIFMWSVGNEIWQADGSQRSIETVQKLVRAIKEIDTERYVTMGEDKFRAGNGEGNHEKVADEIDIQGFNYAEQNYDAFHEKYPEWIIYGSETSSATKSRGVYSHIDSIRVQDNQHQDYQQSSVDNDHVGWGKSATNSWKPDRDRKYVLGQFIWTGFDYIGEATPWHNVWPPKSSYFGIVDTAGFPKDDFYLYQSQWNDVKTKPMVHIMPHWNWVTKLLQQI